MHKRSIATLCTAFALAAAAATAHAGLVVDTGTPTGTGFPLALNSSDFYAGRFTLSQAASVTALSAYITGGTPGETFTLALYADSANLPDTTALFSATATMGADGWNGVSGLTGWLLAAGSYWEAIEIGPTDTLGNGSITGALLPVGSPNPVARTAFDDGGFSGYTATAQPLSIGLRVEVPEPASLLLVLAALPLLGLVARRTHG